MALNLLQVVQTTQAELGLPQSLSVVGNTDVTTTQMFALANRVVDELMRMNRWTRLQQEFNLVVTPAIFTTGNLSQNSPVITNIPSTSGIDAANWVCAGNGIPQAARVLSVDSLSQVTLTMEPTGTSQVGADI